jgi:nucleotide-binding universal stress UspA family protein
MLLNAPVRLRSDLPGGLPAADDAEAEMYKKILVPLDGSQRAEAILRHVEELALCFQARVIFVRVVEAAPLVMAPEIAYVNLRRNEFERRVKEAEAYLATRQGKLREIGIDTDVRVTVGPVVEGIVKLADREDVDLIALASHGRSGLSQVFYGSVAAGLLQRVNRPLLLIRAEA